MSTALQPIITKAGLSAVFRADSTGVAAQITHVVLGSQGYTPNNEQKTLRAQVAKYPIAGGERLGDHQIHLTAVADGDRAYWVREVGFLLSDGTLLAVWSHPTEALAYKPVATELLLAYDLLLAALPANSVTITSLPGGLNLTMAAPLATLAAAQLAADLRGLNQQDVLSDHGKQHASSSIQLEDLSSRMQEVERQRANDREGMLGAIVANAAGIIATQTLFATTKYGA
ncbi:phage tail-collar fiber domain-containing protein [Pseudomonas sp. MF6768]|uniref:phage tail-collar fiber domain-containing protein n=1 Tax=Pseudomonas sp. MF6768 TaxID=2797532 RepID=UPI0018E8EC5D|nr:phage tail protein [Pseudomonas sp. MF6768]MBJ2241951.1 phage tail protein [Pseudomonas sp. MF6768]